MRVGKTHVLLALIILWLGQGEVDGPELRTLRLNPLSYNSIVQ